MSDLITSWYEMFCIVAYLTMVDGNWLVISFMLDSIGVKMDLSSLKLKQQRMASIYVHWERASVCSF